MTTRNRNLFQAILRLTVVFIVGWAVAFWPARLGRPDGGVQWMSIAAACCLVSGWVAVVLESIPAFRGDIRLMLGQMGVRVFAVVAAAIVVRLLHPEFGIVDFYGWLIGFYLLAMTTEVALLRQKFASLSVASDPDPNSRMTDSSTGKL